MKSCSLCGSLHLEVLYQSSGLPIFPNRAYSTIQEAQNAPLGNLQIVGCTHCGFVFNAKFEVEKVMLDPVYENEHRHSPYYRNHLKRIISLLKREVPVAERITEIGCGKGYFLELLEAEDFDILGFDPAYDGEHPFIKKEFFDETKSTQDADLVVLRHVLSTVPNPLQFLQKIALANGGKGKVYIEVNDFEWIARKNSFCDFVYDQAVFFTSRSLASMFRKCKTGKLFHGQYIYAIADLADLLEEPLNNGQEADFSEVDFQEDVDTYREWAQQAKKVIIWGAGGKGVTFQHLVDPENKLVQYFVDVNPNKQHKFMSPTGLEVKSPEELNADPDILSYQIFVVNPNYFAEVEEMILHEEAEIVTFR